MLVLTNGLFRPVALHSSVVQIDRHFKSYFWPSIHKWILSENFFAVKCLVKHWLCYYILIHSDTYWLTRSFDIFHMSCGKIVTRLQYGTLRYYKLGQKTPNHHDSSPDVECHTPGLLFLRALPVVRPKILDVVMSPPQDSRENRARPTRPGVPARDRRINLWPGFQDGRVWVDFTNIETNAKEPGEI